MDISAPVVTAFTAPESSTTLTVPITSFTATDNVAVTGYLVTESGAAPAPGAAGWSTTAPTSYTFSSGGNKTLYGWAKDGAGNVSAGAATPVTVTVPDTSAPVVTAFSVPATSTSLTVAITTFTASDNTAVTGFLVTESATAPAASDPVWAPTAPTFYTFASEGRKTLYAWAKDAAANVSPARSASVIVDQTAPTAPATLTATATSSTLVNLGWGAASDAIGVAGYRILRNATQIGTSTTTGYADLTVSPATSYTYTVRAYDAAGNVSADSNPATVTTPSGPQPPVLDLAVTTKQGNGGRTITSPSFSTAQANELLVAFIASDGPNRGGGQQITSVSGAGLTWTRRSRANSQAGTAEIWTARATTRVANVTVTATRSVASRDGMITVAAFRGASLTVNGAVANASAASGAPTVTLTTTRVNSLIWGVGDDWDRAVSRTVPAGQVVHTEYLSPAGDTFWVQYRSAPTATAGTTATLSCTAPTNDRWNFAEIEIVPQ